MLRNETESTVYVDRRMTGFWDGGNLGLDIADEQGNRVPLPFLTHVPPPPPKQEASSLLPLESGYQYGTWLQFAIKDLFPKPGRYSIRITYHDWLPKEFIPQELRTQRVLGADAPAIVSEPLWIEVIANWQARALDLALPDRCASSTDARWLACIRIVPGYAEETEYLLSIEKRYDGTLRAQIVRPKGTSIRAQLREQKKEHPRAPVSELTGLIHVESRAGDQHRFPGLARLVSEFEQIRFPLVPSDGIMMDATQYRFCVRSSASEQVEILLGGAGSGAVHQQQPVIQWAESVRQMLAEAFQ